MGNSTEESATIDRLQTVEIHSNQYMIQKKGISEMLFTVDKTVLEEEAFGQGDPTHLH